MNSKNIVVIGGGAAALFSAQAARSSDNEANITLVCGEKKLPYYRTRICEVFSGLAPESLVVKPLKWFEDNNINIIMDIADKIDSPNMTVTLKGGDTIKYDELIIATGADGNRLPVPGKDLPGVLSIRTLDDIANAQTYPGTALVIGGGLLGLEAAWNLKKAGRDVKIVEYWGWLLGRQLDQEAGEFFHDIVRNAGIEIITKAQLKEITGEALELVAHFAEGEDQKGGLVIFAAGIIPNITLGRDAGLETNRAIIVDSKMRTSSDHIYACGDCAELEGKVAGLWSVSMAQGNIAGQNAAGIDADYIPEEPPYLLNAMGTRIWSNGNLNTEDSHVVKEPENGILKKLFFVDGMLKGAILIGDVALQGKLKEAIKQSLNKEEAINLLK